MNSRVVVFAFVVVLVGGLPGAVAAGSGLESAATTGADSPNLERVTVDGHDRPFANGDATTASTAVLHRTTTLEHRPDDPGEFGAEITFEVPDAVVDLEVDVLESGAAVESTDGFEPTGDGSYEWTGETDAPSLEVTVPTDRAGDDGHQRTDASHGTDGYTFVDTGEWGIVRVPQVSLAWHETESVALEETATVDGPGATGGDIAVFGEVTEHERETDGERIRLVVPEAADLDETPGDVLETLAVASDALEVGERPDELFVVAAPTDAEWGPRGLQYGEGDAWVRADAPLAEPSNVWIHEYVHARQGFAGDTTSETAWLVEAQAEYYAALIALEKGLIDFAEFERFLERGEREPYADDVLAEPASWDDETDYVKGPLVYGELDRQLRLATDGDRTLEVVFRELNAEKGTVTETEFLEALNDVGGADVRESAERYTQTKAVPSAWDRASHEAAFDQSVTAVDYGFAPEPLAVADEPWEQWERDGEPVTAVPVGEPVSVPVTAENVGDRDGSYDATLRVDGEVVDAAGGKLEAGDRTTDSLEWTPAERGSHELRVGSETMTVFVRDEASVTVTDLAVDPADVDPGEPTTVTATVEPAGDGPGAAVLEVYTPDGLAAEQPVVVRETATLEHELTFDEDGYYEVAVGDRTETVSVGALPPAQLEEVPGFGAVAAIVAIVGALLVARLRFGSS